MIERTIVPGWYVVRAKTLEVMIGPFSTYTDARLERHAFEDKQNLSLVRFDGSNIPKEE